MKFADLQRGVLYQAGQSRPRPALVIDTETKYVAYEPSGAWWSLRRDRRFIGDPKGNKVLTLHHRTWYTDDVRVPVEEAAKYTAADYFNDVPEPTGWKVASDALGQIVGTWDDHLEEKRQVDIARARYESEREQARKERDRRMTHIVRMAEHRHLPRPGFAKSGDSAFKVVLEPDEFERLLERIRP